MSLLSYRRIGQPTVVARASMMNRWTVEGGIADRRSVVEDDPPNGLGSVRVDGRADEPSPLLLCHQSYPPTLSPHHHPHRLRPFAPKVVRSRINRTVAKTSTTVPPRFTGRQDGRRLTIRRRRWALRFPKGHRQPDQQDGRKNQLADSFGRFRRRQSGRGGGRSEANSGCQFLRPSRGLLPPVGALLDPYRQELCPSAYAARGSQANQPPARYPLRSMGLCPTNSTMRKFILVTVRPQSTWSAAYCSAT